MYWLHIALLLTLLAIRGWSSKKNNNKNKITFKVGRHRSSWILFPTRVIEKKSSWIGPRWASTLSPSLSIFYNPSSRFVSPTSRHALGLRDLAGQLNQCFYIKIKIKKIFFSKKKKRFIGTLRTAETCHDKYIHDYVQKR